MRYELWARDHGDTNGLHWILTAASVGPSTFLHLEKAMGKGTHPAFLQGSRAAQSPHREKSYDGQVLICSCVPPYFEYRSCSKPGAFLAVSSTY